MFWENSNELIADVSDIVLSKYGEIVLKTISDISNHYMNVNVDCFTIMPNHIHLLLSIHTPTSGRSVTAPTISEIIRRTKSLSTRKTGKPLWQKGFYDHIIRDEADYVAVSDYIKYNPFKWIDDKLYTK